MPYECTLIGLHCVEKQLWQYTRLMTSQEIPKNFREVMLVLKFHMILKVAYAKSGQGVINCTSFGKSIDYHALLLIG